MPKTIGSHRFCFAGFDAYRPYYAKRSKYLPFVERTMLQIQILFLGELAWINVSQGDLRPANWVWLGSPTR